MPSFSSLITTVVGRCYYHSYFTERRTEVKWLAQGTVSVWGIYGTQLFPTPASKLSRLSHLTTGITKCPSVIGNLPMAFWEKFYNQSLIFVHLFSQQSGWYFLGMCVLRHMPPLSKGGSHSSVVLDFIFSWHSTFVLSVTFQFSKLFSFSECSQAYIIRKR